MTSSTVFSIYEIIFERSFEKILIFLCQDIKRVTALFIGRFNVCNESNQWLQINSLDKAALQDLRTSTVHCPLSSSRNLRIFRTAFTRIFCLSVSTRLVKYATEEISRRLEEKFFRAMFQE